jgi:small-conductance mechanosensitive channel
MASGPSLLWNGAWSSLWAGDVPWVAAMGATLGALLYVLRPQDRASLVNTLVVYAGSLCGLLVAGGLASSGFESGAASTREASVVLGGIAIIRLWGQFFFRVVLPAARFTPPRILEDLVVIVAYCAWGLVRLRLAGLDLSGIVATSAVITAVVAFSMQETLGNVLGGLALEFDSAFEIGDWIRVDEVVGRVVDIRWRSTSIETRNWETVIVPNAHLVRSKVAVLGRRVGQPRKLRRWIWFNVDLGTSAGRVVKTVTDALGRMSLENVATDPVPDCLLMEFQDGYARYAVRYWLLDIARDDATDAGVREHVLAALQRAGIRLAVPERTVHVVAEDQAHAEVVRARELERRLGALGGVDLFKELTPEELTTMAGRLVNAPFARGDLVTRQGAVAHWLYLLTAGSVEVMLERPDREPHRLAVLDAPTFFGEMGLLTGEPRHATVRALGPVECYRLDKAGFEDILQVRPALAQTISKLLAERQNDIDRVTHHLAAQGRNEGVGHRSDEILERIKRFFGIGSA